MSLFVVQELPPRGFTILWNVDRLGRKTWSRQASLSGNPPHVTRVFSIEIICRILYRPRIVPRAQGLFGSVLPVHNVPSHDGCTLFVWSLYFPCVRIRLFTPYVCLFISSTSVKRHSPLKIVNIRCPTCISLARVPFC